MKSLLAFLVFSVTVSQITGEGLKITIYYDNHGKDCQDFFKDQVAPIFEDEILRDWLDFELVPFGLCNFTEQPPRVTCRGGENTYYGNAMNACVMQKNSDHIEQTKFVSCCMFDDNPPSAGRNCAEKLGLDYYDVEECTFNREGLELEIENGKKTKRFDSELSFVPTVAFDDKYTEEDQEEALSSLRSVVIRKLREKGFDI